GADLSGSNLGAAIFTHTNLDLANLTNAYLTSARMPNGSIHPG
ncbi:MAG: pentapeptide repeat-containing protein, partial [Actinobacteria bacterium]|nr:pentapeptide repeat-containing protein [Actinomycetota bacterium]